MSALETNPIFSEISMMKQRYFLPLAVLAAFLGLCTLLNAQEAKKAKVLHFTRSQGFEHDPAKLRPDGTTLSGQALKTYFADKNIELVETQDGGAFDGDLSQYDGFIFYTSGNLLNGDGSKNDKAKPMTADGLRKMIAAVRAGKGFVGIHSGTDTVCGLNEDGVDLYTKFVGARFDSHGAQQFGTATIVEPIEFPHLKDSGKRITTWEEWYGMRQYNKDLHVILYMETADMVGREYSRPPFPLCWIRKEGTGRVAYSAFGHQNQYFQNAENVRRIGELVEWSVGRFEADTTPNIDKVTPGANELPPRN
jgi:type 1 glutamine amidotransferase